MATPEDHIAAGLLRGGRGGRGRIGRVPHVVIVGGGISGLAAAARLRDRLGERLRLTVVEQARQLGGKLRTGELAGVPVEYGAEAFLLRDPAPRALAERVGVGDALVHPTGGAAIAVGGALRPIPRGTLLGVPGDLGALAGSGVASPVAEPPGEGPLLADDGDVAVGTLVRRHLGDEVADRLVDPMLGGTYAGRADELSLATTMPALAATARYETTLTSAVRAALAAGPRRTGPIFATVQGGLSTMVEAVAGASRAQLRLGLPVRELTRTPTGWRLVVGATRAPEIVGADGVVLAVPATPAARLLRAVSPGAAAEVSTLEYASIALVLLALPERAESLLPDLTGFLVPATEGHAVKAATFFTRKWPHLRHGVTLVRASLGRHRDERVIQRDDADLVALVRRELDALVGVALPAPTATAVSRWGGALPQYAPGHLDRVRRARAALAGEPTLALAGAAYDGIGIAACVRSGEQAADHLLTALDRPGESTHG